MELRNADESRNLYRFQSLYSIIYDSRGVRREGGGGGGVRANPPFGYELFKYVRKVNM